MSNAILLPFSRFVSYENWLAIYVDVSDDQCRYYHETVKINALALDISQFF